MTDAVASCEAVFDEIAAAGRRVNLWWRDDDAVANTPALDTLLEVAARHHCPIALAVIPAQAEATLRDRIDAEPSVDVLVHGWSHKNHAARGEKSAEFGARRDKEAMADEAARALDLIAGMFGSRAVPVFVPPWNRIAPDLAKSLPALGYAGLSTFGADRFEVFGLRQVHTHLDPVDWRGHRGLAAADLLVRMLKRAVARGDRTIGLLTHHLAFDAALWDFVDRFVGMAARHPAVELSSIADLLARPDACAGRSNREARTSLEAAA